MAAMHKNHRSQTTASKNRITVLPMLCSGWEIIVTQHVRMILKVPTWAGNRNNMSLQLAGATALPTEYVGGPTVFFQGRYFVALPKR